MKTLTIVVLVRSFEQWRRDASENVMRAITVERLVFNVFVAVGKIAERSSPSSCDGVDYERWRVFECVEFCKENGAFENAVQMSIR